MNNQYIKRFIETFFQRERKQVKDTDLKIKYLVFYLVFFFVGQV